MLMRKYKNLMDNYVLPNDEKEKSINRILDKTINQKNIKIQKHSKKKIILSITAVAACGALISGFSVAAMNGYNWANLLYGIKSDDNSQVYAQKYDGFATDFTYNIPDYDAELVNSFGNDKLISIVLKLTPHEDISNSETGYDFAFSSLSGGDERFETVESRSNYDEEGNVWLAVNFGMLETEESGNVNYRIEAISNEDNNKVDIGSISFNFNADESITCPRIFTEQYAESLKVQSISVTPVSIYVQGEAAMATDCFSNLDIYYTDESGCEQMFSADCTNWSATAEGSHYNRDGLFIFDKVLDCSNITAVNINGVMFDMD